MGHGHMGRVILYGMSSSWWFGLMGCVVLWACHLMGHVVSSGMLCKGHVVLGHIVLWHVVLWGMLPSYGTYRHLGSFLA